jgi:membrane protease YdiL (CAAX protease family)
MKMREKFGARTIFIPILAIIGFYVIQTLVLLVYMLPYMIRQTVLKGNSSPADLVVQEIIADSLKYIMSQMNIIGIIYSVIIVGIAIPVILILLRKNPYAIRRERIRSHELIAAAVVMIGAAGIVNLEMAGIQAAGEFVPWVKNALQTYIELSKSLVGSKNIFLIIISTCILIPIAEDLVFRGIVQGELRRVMPGYLAVIIQAVIFALVHGNIIQISYVIIPALILGAIYEWTRSIYVPIILHMIFNFFGAGLPMIFEGNEFAQQAIVITEIILIIPAVLAMMYLYKRRRLDLVPNTGILDDNAENNDAGDGIEVIYGANTEEADTVNVTESAKIWKHTDI